MVIMLRVLLGPELEEEISISESRFTIGRADDCNLRPNCPMVSRHHCELVVDGSVVSIRDANSKNGTFVNGQRVVGQQVLKSGDLVGLGLRRLAVTIDPAGLAVPSQPADDEPARSPVNGRKEAVGEGFAECLPCTPA